MLITLYNKKWLDISIFTRINKKIKNAAKNRAEKIFSTFPSWGINTFDQWNIDHCYLMNNIQFLM